MMRLSERMNPLGVSLLMISVGELASASVGAKIFWKHRRGGKVLEVARAAESVVGRAYVRKACIE